MNWILVMVVLTVGHGGQRYEIVTVRFNTELVCDHVKEEIKIASGLRGTRYAECIFDAATP